MKIYIRIVFLLYIISSSVNNQLTIERLKEEKWPRTS